MEKFVTDLGIAAYLMMHGFQVNGKKGKSIYFECNNEEEDKSIERLILDYMPPSEFYLFDSCLMALKKINPWKTAIEKENSFEIIEVLSDMGQAAYILMKEYTDPKGFGILGRGSNKEIYFKVPEGLSREFKQRSFTYLSSNFHNFDSSLMALKKIGEYTR